MGSATLFRGETITLLQSEAEAELALRVSDQAGQLVTASAPLPIRRGSGLVTNVLETPNVRLDARWTELRLEAVLTRPADGQTITNSGVRAYPVASAPTPQAQLTVTRQSPASISIAWTEEARDFSLESALLIGPGMIWAPVNGVPEPLTGAGSIEVPTSAGAQCYRIRK